MATTQSGRRLPIGAEIIPTGGVHFRVWAPKRRTVEVLCEGATVASQAVQRACALTHEDEGFFSGSVPTARAGTLYRFRLDGGPDLYPDPASRFQPDGPHGPSQVIDPCAFAWSDHDWRGIGTEGQVIYEFHVGTLTREGTFASAARQLGKLAELGVTVLEIMPVADFPGRFGWGYDGVNLFAPTRLYGTPDEFRRFVDEAHAAGLGVILDVVYNHIGPDGNYLGQFSDHYFTRRYENEWGEALNFDGEHAGPVRTFFTANAAYWIDEFHLDGLRLDATQQIFDASSEHILTDLARAVRRAARGRSTLLVAENESQHTRLVWPVEQGGHGLDMLWNDDFHHSAQVLLTGHNEAYYTDYQGTPQEFISAVKYGYLYQGQRYAWQQKRRGMPAFGLKPSAFVTFLENHDQVANSGRGARSHQLTDPGRLRAMTALLLLGPGTPMLFQGQEFATSSPFLYFADHNPDLAHLVRKGRREFLAQFPTLALSAMQDTLAEPSDPETFTRCKLDFSERDQNAPIYRLHQDLLRLRREDPVFRAQRPGGVDGAVLGPEAFVLRYFGGADGDRLLVVNFGRDLRLEPAPEPLLAPPGEAGWEMLWSSEDPRYGGCGTLPPESDTGWRLPGHAAVALAPSRAQTPPGHTSPQARPRG